MASKAVLLVLLACFLLINTKGSTGNANFKSSPPPPPITKATPPPKSPSPPPVSKATPPPPAPVKAPPPPLCPPPPPVPPKNREECIPLCTVRCKNHSRKNICMRACLACCERCKCVPPGQYGNYEKCGKCYSTMTTHGGKLKCP